MVRFTVANCRLTLPLLRVEMKRVATMVGEKAVMHVEYALIMFFLHAHVHREFPSSPSFLSLAFVLFVCACVRMRAGGENGRGCFVLMSSNENTATGRHATGARMAVLLFTFLRLAHYCRFLIKNNGSG
jgi:hypothetical protein